MPDPTTLPKVARTGVLAYLRHLAEGAEDVGEDGALLTYSKLQSDGREWMMGHGWDSYSANNLGRRLREIASDDPAHAPRMNDYGIRLRPVPHPTAEKAWNVSLTKGAPTETPSRPTTPRPVTASQTGLPAPPDPSAPPTSPSHVGTDPWAAPRS